MTAIVEREFEYYGASGVEAGVVRLFAPEPDPPNAWRCRFEVIWPGFERRGRVLGVDAWQALSLGIFRAAVEIGTSQDCKDGRVGIWGEVIRGYDHACEIFGGKPVGAPNQ